MLKIKPWKLTMEAWRLKDKMGVLEFLTIDSRFLSI